MAMLVALSLILVMLINFPILPAIPFMKYDPADIPILIGSFLFGPMGGVILTAIVSILQGLFISGDGGPIGIVMVLLLLLPDLFINVQKQNVLLLSV